MTDFYVHKHRESFPQSRALKAGGHDVLFLTGTDPRSLCDAMHRAGNGLFDEEFEACATTKSTINGTLNFSYFVMASLHYPFACR